MYRFYFKRWLCLLVIFCGFGLSSGLGQKILGFHFKKENRRKYSFNFKLYNNLIVLPIRVNDLDTLNFVLDTGVSNTLITDPSVKDSLGLECLREVDVAGASGGNVLKGCITLVKNIRLRGIQSFDHGLIILQEDVLELSSYAGVKIHGIIGHDLLSRFVVQIDYIGERIVFYNPKKYRHRGKSRYFPLQMQQQKPYLKAKARLNEKEVDVKLLLDIGAGHSLSLDVGSHPAIQVPDKHLPTHLGMTLNGIVKGSVGRISEFRIGKFSWNQVICSFPDSLSLKYVRNNNNRQGNLGVGILRRFRLVLDYPNQRVGLRRNRLYREPFELNTSGIEISAKAPDFEEYMVSYIRPSSPAAKIGIEKGDIIVAVDDIHAGSLPINQIYDKINKKAGERSTIFVKRDGNYYLVELKLEDPI